jgi:hypothetical protein
MYLPKGEFKEGRRHCMNKKEATSYLRLILTKCDISPEAFAILDPLPNNKTKGYRIGLKANIDNESMKKIDQILKQNHLSIVNERGQVVISST